MKVKRFDFIVSSLCTSYTVFLQPSIDIKILDKGPLSIWSEPNKYLSTYLALLGSFSVFITSWNSVVPGGKGLNIQSYYESSYLY